MKLIQLKTAVFVAAEVQGIELRDHRTVYVDIRGRTESIEIDYDDDEQAAQSDYLKAVQVLREKADA